MMYLLVSIFFVIQQKGKHSLTKLFFWFTIFSTIAAYMVGRLPLLSFKEGFYSIYIIALLSLLFLSFRNYTDLRGFNFQDIDSRRLKTFETVSIILGILVLLVYTYILSKIFTLLLMQEITVQEHKNEGGAADTWATMVPHIFITLGNFLSPLGYFYLFLHFYYLLKRRVSKSVLYLVLSLCIVLNGLIALSRSATVMYVMLYASILYVVLPLLSKKTKRGLLIAASIVFIGIFSALVTISNSRFSEFFRKDSRNVAIIDENKQPILFSTLDYFGQWQEVGPMLMDRYNWGDLSWGTFNSSAIILQADVVIRGAKVVNEERSKKYDRLIGDLRSSFYGLIGALIWDFGILGTPFFIIFLCYLNKRLSPRNKILTTKSLMMLLSILPVAVVFWAGNNLNNLVLNMSMVYLFFIYKFLTTPVKIRRVRQLQQ